ncbi:MAG: TRAP transporter large permease subunit, partial [Chloroflexota bacterium]
MDPLIIGITGVVVFLVLVLLGTWIGYAAATVGLIGIVLVKGWEGMGGIAGYLPYSSTASFEFSVIPLFIIMGYFAYYAGLSRDIFHATRQWFGHFPGGLAIASVFGCAAFGAVCGSSTAATVVMGKVAIPEMRRYNYDPKLATAAVAASGTMASMIPPSIVMVIYGVITQQSIGRLLMAGYIPGLLEAILYTAMIYVRCRRNPMLGAALAAASWKERLLSLKGTWSFLLLAGVILGGIYFGVFTPTEAGGAGA